MDYNKVNTLLEKYFKGTSSLQEEQELKKYFKYQQHIPQEFQYAKVLFAQQDKEARETFEKELLPIKESHKNNWIVNTLKIAATLTLLTGLFYFMQQPDEPKPYAYINGKAVKDKKRAIHETRKALFSITTRLNQGTKGLSQLSKFNEVNQNISQKNKP